MAQAAQLHGADLQGERKESSGSGGCEFIPKPQAQLLHEHDVQGAQEKSEPGEDDGDEEFEAEQLFVSITSWSAGRNRLERASFRDLKDFALYVVWFHS